MGVPKFFRWISERYPCLSELVREYQIPTFDNLYLDMNGIIHTCSHPNDFDPHFRITEEKIFKDIFHYIEVLFRMIRPQKLFFMAVDGVAPRAKMNQQRGRRFRSAKEAEVLEKKAQEKGETLPSEARFDSNCITPGTEFMARLHEQLKYFVTYKVSTDPLWQKCKVILSGHETPGEGEHKIMDYIRYMKSRPDHDPNTRHCLYGLDADLIMLGLCSHEPHFSLLREEVKFVRTKQKQRTTTPEEQPFYLLHLSLLREYLELEFQVLKDKLSFPYDVEQIIDDWVLMGFLVGNDFIPPLPDMHIANGALPILYEAYIQVLPSLGGYINESGTLNLERFQKYMEKLSAFDINQFRETYADLKYFEGKTGRKLGSKERKSYKTIDSEEKTEVAKLRDIAALLSEEENVGVIEKVSSGIKSSDSSEIVAVEDGTIVPCQEKQLLSQDTSSSLSNEIATVKDDTITSIQHKQLSQDASSLSKEHLTVSKDETNQEHVPDSESPKYCEDNTKLENSGKRLNPDLEALIKVTEDMLLGTSSVGEDFDDMEDAEDDYETEEEEEEDNFYMEFYQHKRDYYMNKLEYATVNEEVLRSQAEGYVRAIQWNLNYYYNGVCSWSWFYPHHYAPYISDIRNFSDLKLEFDLGIPFLPFQQLLAVLPAASKKLLPEPYQSLMVNSESPIISYYPPQFKTDLNGKKQEWEAVVLIPFIDETILLGAMEPINKLLTPEELKRNSHGPALIYEYTVDDLGHYAAPEFFPSLAANHAKMVELWREDIFVEQSKLVKGLCAGTKLDVYFPGFPTFKHLNYTAFLEKRKVKVFEMASRGDNMIVRILNETKPDLKEVAKNFLGKTVFVDWPHLIEAKVVAVASREFRYSLPQESPSDSSEEVSEVVEEVKGNLASVWVSQKNGIQERYMNRLGIDIGNTEILLQCLPMVGRQFIFGKQGRITLDKQWSKHASAYALQAVVKDISVHDPTFVDYLNMEEVFPAGSCVFLLGIPHYGYMGEVRGYEEAVHKSGRVKITVTVSSEPIFGSAREKHINFRANYMPGGIAAQRLGISAHLLSRITGTIYITPSLNERVTGNDFKTNIGLNLKFNKRNEEVPGYTKKDNGMWLYSHKAVELVASYIKKFPELFDYLSANTGNDFIEADAFPNSKDLLNDITNWLKDQPFYNVERRVCGAAVLDPEVVHEIEEIVDKFYLSRLTMKSVTMQVKPHLLFKPSMQTGCLPPDPDASYLLFDRVVNVRESYTVPLGWKGTIIAIHKGEKDADTMYDVVFDKPFAGGMAIICSANRGYRVPRYALVNLSHGERLAHEKDLRERTEKKIPALPSGNDVSNSGTYTFSPSWSSSQSQQLQQRLNTVPFAPSANNSQNIVSSHPNSAFASWRSNQGSIPTVNHQSFGKIPHSSQIPLQGGVKGPHSWRQRPQPPTQIIQRPPIQRLQIQPEMQQQLQILLNKNPNVAAQLPMNEQLPQKPSQQPTPQLAKTVSPNEFQLMWSELQGLSKPGATGETSKRIGQSSQPSSHVVNDSGTEILKKMLRITEVSTENPQPVSSSQQSMKQVSVQEMFEHARASESKNITFGESSCTMQLMKMFQLQGQPLPRYTYTENKDQTFVAQVTLPNMRSFTGVGASTKEQAGENAAKVALSQVTLERNSFQGHANNNTGISGSRPLTNNLPSPPQQWCWPQNQQLRPSRFHQQDLHQNKQDWRIRNDLTSSFGNHPTNSWMRHQQPPQIAPSQPYSPYVVNLQQMRTPPRTNWRDDLRQGSQFVPLQAVKQQRSKSGIQQHQQQHQQQKHQQQPQQLQLQPQWNIKSKSQQKEQCKLETQQLQSLQQFETSERSQESSNSEEVSSKENFQAETNKGSITPESSRGRFGGTPKPRQKKSRIAANFASSSAEQS